MAEREVRFDDGNWHAMTLGHFIGLLVDAGDNDVAVTMRVTWDSKPDDGGQYVRGMEVNLIPNGQVVDVIIAGQINSVHKTLKALIDAGQVR